ncbi:uncharacterized protein [Ranitomeya imitator]|uniref:uncharacterized protein n=1 Tax=Ranitomeya imitator TaxID=111125 RepID=UPI0037E8A48B
MYERQAYSLLEDAQCYRRLTYNPLSSFHQILVDIMGKALDDGLITKNFFEKIRDLHPRLCTFYLIPKVHKDPVDPPGRPIVAGNGGLCEVISEVIDYFLKPIVSSLPSFVRDTSQVLQRIDELEMEENMLLVTADVESLYTSIRHEDGLEATSWFLRTSNIDNCLVDLIMTLLDFVLRHNSFIFNGRIYLQCQGTAMGASCAPSYANLFLGAWERKIFLEDDIMEIKQVHNWMPYIDDVLFIWEGPEEGLGCLMEKLNNNNQNIRLTFKSGRSLEFLDIWIDISINGRLKTDVYRKPTATNSYLRADSAHPVNTIRGIPIGQFLRMRKICSDNESFERQCMDLSARFTERGYSKKMIQRGYNRAKRTPRNELLYGNRRLLRKEDDKQYLFHIWREILLSVPFGLWKEWNYSGYGRVLKKKREKKK